MGMGRPKKNDYPPYMTVDGDRGGFVVRNPVNGKKKRYGSDHETEARRTAAALAEFVELRRRRMLLESGLPTLALVIDRWEFERLPLMPWDTSTVATAKMRLKRIKKERGDELIDAIDCVSIEKWISAIAAKADPFNKWRQMWVWLYRFAVSQKLAKTNEAEKVERRSVSRKIKSNRKDRQQIDTAGFNDVYAHAEPWLQLAMEASLLTLQSRKEVCGFKHTDFRDGFLFVIRDKVAADSHMAFIKIRLTSEIEALRARAIKLDSIVSPYLIHRRPDRMQRRWLQGKDHWTYINGRYLTRAFKAARDLVPRFKALPERQRPTFHEIRGLGSRLCLDRGMTKEAISALMTHSSKKTTEIYLERGPQALTDDDFHAVSAPFTLKELLGKT
jgi:enterobacteria phage integrase